MAKTAVKADRKSDDVATLDRTYFEAVKNNDGRTIADLTDDPCIVVGPQGIRKMKRDEVAAMASDRNHELKSYRLDDANREVLMVNDDLAIVAYKAHTAMSTSEPMDAFDSSVWVRRNGNWRCALHTETPATGTA